MYLLEIAWGPLFPNVKCEVIHNKVVLVLKFHNFERHTVSREGNFINESARMTDKKQKRCVTEIYLTFE